MVDPRPKQPIYCPECGGIAWTEPRDDTPHLCPQCGAACQAQDGEQVFISFSSRDVDIAARIAERLGKTGIRFWLAPEVIRGGEAFLTVIPRAIEACRVALVLISESSVRSPWVVREAALAVSSGKFLLPVCLGTVALNEDWSFVLALSQWMRAESTFPEEDLRRVVHAVRRGLAPATARTLVTEAGAAARQIEPPKGVDPGAVVYMGPRPFPDGMGSRFFGRERELAQLLDLIRDRPGVLLISPSGAGKSSLLAAGLGPALRAAGTQVLAGARVGRALAREVAAREGEIPNIFVFASMYGLGELPPSSAPALTLEQSLRRIPLDRPRQRRVVIFDQFEEIFTQHRHRFTDRAGFVAQLVDALRDDPDLRVVLAMRQEYLADYQALTESIPPRQRPAVVPLRRMGRDALVEVIRRPAETWAHYAEGLAEEIVDQLNQVRVVQPDGSLGLRPGEHVELVHLQIVCERLWRSLDQGLKLVERQHLDHVADGVLGRDFGGFVRNALESFYSEVVLRVALSAATERQGGYSVELIKLGCMRFVGRDGTRCSITEGRERTGRLPNWIIAQLADLYLLRSDTAGSERWYELSHDLLAETVGRERDQAVSDLLFACELLEKQLERTLAVHGGSLRGCFESHPSLLAACHRFRTQPGLFAEEAEFLLRASLRDGIDLAEWSRRTRSDFPQRRLAVMNEALRSPIQAVRLHAAKVLWEDPEPPRPARADFATPPKSSQPSEGGSRAAPAGEPAGGAAATSAGPIGGLVVAPIAGAAAGDVDGDRERDLDEGLVSLVLRDEDAEVRRSAAFGLLHLDRAAHFAKVMGELGSEHPSTGARRAGAILLALADERPPSRFDLAYAALPLRRRAATRLRAWGIRLRDSLPSLTYAVIPGALGGALAAGAYKWIPGALNWALVQADVGALNGSFHGVVAGAIWGGGICAGIALHRLVFLRARSPRSTLRPVGALVAGVVAGVISSTLVVMVVVTVFDPHSLARMGWVDGGAGAPVSASPLAAPGGIELRSSALLPGRFSGEFLHDLFVKTRMGWAHLILGTAMGLGIALMTNRLRSSPRWQRLLREPHAVTSVGSLVGVARRTVRVVLPSAWLVILTQLLGGLAVLWLLRPGDNATPEKQSVLYGVIGDASTQVIGAIGVITGLGVGVVLLRRGLNIPPRDTT